MAKIVYRAACWDCNDFCIGKTKRRLHDRKFEHFKALINGNHTSALADHVISTGHSLKWDHFEILAIGRSDTHCKIKETLLIKDLICQQRKAVSLLDFFCHLYCYLIVISQ